MRYLTTVFLTAVIFLFCACGNSSTQEPTKTTTASRTNASDTLSPKTLKELQILYNVLGGSLADSLVSEADTGREVSMEDALDCIGIFPREMHKHGIRVNGGRDVELGRVKSKKITQAEVFRGRGLRDYIIKMAERLDPEGNGNNMEFQLHFGIYTDAFLDKYLQGNEPLKGKKRDRITIFIIPVARQGFKFKNDEEVMAYELGGLQP